MDKQTLKLMTLNIRHGWRTGKKHIFRKKEIIQENLDMIAALQRKEKAAIVALQEADRQSVWSGKFNHIAYLAAKADYREAIQGAHVNGAKLRLFYGTALLSRLAFMGSKSVRFRPHPPVFRKGFVTGAVLWPGTDILADVVSLHLDCFRKRVRAKQVREIIDYFSPRQRPLIVMGDFNCDDWEDPESSLRIIADALNLKTYKPKNKTGTFCRNGKRLDWILASPEFKFLSYRVLSGAGVSDHDPVVATLRLRKR